MQVIGDCWTLWRGACESEDGSKGSDDLSLHGGDKPEQTLARMKGHRAYRNRHKNPFT